MRKNIRKRFYILPVWGGIEPQPLIGPFWTYDGMLKRARKVYAKQKEEDSIFWVVIHGYSMKPSPGTFTTDELVNER